MEGGRVQSSGAVCTDAPNKPEYYSHVCYGGKLKAPVLKFCLFSTNIIYLQNNKKYPAFDLLLK